MTPLKKYDLTVKSTILRGEKSNKGLDATAAPTPHQMNRLCGYLMDGTKVLVAQRPGKGGMDFNKLLGGKVFAVAADGMSPVYEKDKDGKATKTQKVEDGLPLYSSSGFYLLSSKDYPALHLMEAFTLLRNKGEQVWLITDQQLAKKNKQVMSDELDFDLVLSTIETLLSDEFNLVKSYDTDINRKRKRGIERAREEAEDTGDTYNGVAFNELAVSKKDGNPFVAFCYQIEGAGVKGGAVLREVEAVDESRDDGRTTVTYLSPAEAMAKFAESPAHADIVQALESGKKVTIGFVQGHVMRTSVSFRRKVENVMAEATKTQYGDAVYILAGLKGWTRGILSIMQSQHPTFPAADYDAHHYVAACRQAEIGMNKKTAGGWSLPEGIHFTMASELLGN